MNTRRAVFLDRDGVVNELIYYEEAGIVDSPFTVEQFALVACAGEAISLLNRMGLKVIVVSNQPGVAKNHFSVHMLSRIDAKMKEELSVCGALLDGIYYCLHHPHAENSPYAKSCQCRKPKPGLLLRAAEDLGVELAESYMVGDNLTDVQAGQAAGCRTILIGKPKCEVCHLMDSQGVRPDLIRENLLLAAKAILEWEKGAQPESLVCPQTTTR